MSVIHFLADDVIPHIAAGEVIGSFSDIVKELVENSLDAHAQTLTVTFNTTHPENPSLTIQDNGVGMDQADLEICWLPQTTSKITHFQDLQSLATFGFRGEALASVATVARLTIQSRQESSIGGHQIVIENRNILQSQSVGMPAGTLVHIEDLFSSVPARKKFLPPHKKEISTITDTLIRHALAHPTVSFSFIHNEKNILSIPAHTSLIERAAHILGETFPQYWLPFEQPLLHGKVSGFIGLPQVARRSTKQQFVLINNRFVMLPNISRTIRDAYGTLLEAHTYPAFIAIFTLDPKSIDPNVHPQKTTIKIQNEEEILQQLFESTQATLSQYDLGFSATKLWRVEDSSPQQEQGQLLKKQTKLWQPSQESLAENIAQIQNLYLVTESPEGITIFDQHALHERILYEQFVAEWKTMQKNPQKIELTQLLRIKLNALDHQTLTELINEFQELGFDLENFDATTWILRSVPKTFQDKDFALFIPQILDDLQTRHTTLHPHQHRLLSYLACRSAIKGGEYLTPQQRKELLDRWNTLKTPYTCPHGRPTCITLSQQQLEKMFHRA